jgi:hypothetical protein
MPIPPGGQGRFSKWLAKFDPATVSARFTQVKDVATVRAQNGLITFATLEELVKPILEKYGVSGTDSAKYQGFAKRLLKLALRNKAESATVVAQGVKSDYVTRLKADPAICDEIIQVVLGWVAPY